MKHQAYNIFSGEIITTTNGNHLKRWVAHENRLAKSFIGSMIIQEEYCKYIRSWRFCHDGRFTK